MREALAARIVVTIYDGDWGEACPDAESIAETTARLVLERADAPVSPIILDITLTDDPEQQRLNRSWRGKDAPTNVLAFPGGDPPARGTPHVLGDVILSLTTIRHEAEEQHKPFADHLRHLVVHGVLHLLGHDHQDAAEAAAMEAREIAILAEFGVPDPYRDTI